MTRIRPTSSRRGASGGARGGLAAAALSNIESEDAAENALKYITRATQEEIWFWASKFLGVVDEGIKRERVIEALSIISARVKMPEKMKASASCSYTLKRNMSARELTACSPLYHDPG